MSEDDEAEPTRGNGWLGTLPTPELMLATQVAALRSKRDLDAAVDAERNRRYRARERAIDIANGRRTLLITCLLLLPLAAAGLHEAERRQWQDEAIGNRVYDHAAASVNDGVIVVYAEEAPRGPKGVYSEDLESAERKLILLHLGPDGQMREQIPLGFTLTGMTDEQHAEHGGMVRSALSMVVDGDLPWIALKDATGCYLFQLDDWRSADRGLAKHTALPMGTLADGTIRHTCSISMETIEGRPVAVVQDTVEISGEGHDDRVTTTTIEVLDLRVGESWLVDSERAELRAVRLGTWNGTAAIMFRHLDRHAVCQLEADHEAACTNLDFGAMPTRADFPAIVHLDDEGALLAWEEGAITRCWRSDGEVGGYVAEDDHEAIARCASGQVRGAFFILSPEGEAVEVNTPGLERADRLVHAAFSENGELLWAMWFMDAPESEGTGLWMDGESWVLDPIPAAGWNWMYAFS